MNRKRAIATCCTTMLSVVAFVATSAASAAEPHFVFPAGIHHLEVKITMPSSTVTKFYYDGTTTVMAECKSARGVGEAYNGAGETGKIKQLELTYEECSVPHSSCLFDGTASEGSMKSLEVTGALGYKVGSTTEVLLHMSPAGGDFTKVDFSGTCPIPTGSYYVEKGIIAQIPDTGSSLPSFEAVFAVNGSHEQLVKEIENPGASTHVADELKVGTLPVGVEGKLIFAYPSGDDVTIATS